LVTFWATTCPSCIEEIPHLIDLYRELNPKGLEIIGVAMAYDPPEQVRAMAANSVKSPTPSFWTRKSASPRV
jgi:thiol-disulfide isomerase/thioredoxin